MKVKTERDDEVQSLYLERVEAAGFAALTHALIDCDMRLAWSVVKLLRYLSIV